MRQPRDSSALVQKVAQIIVWLGRFVKGWLPRALGAGAALAFAIWGSLGGGGWTTGGWLFIAGIAAAIAALLAEIFVQRPSYMQLAKLREAAENRADVKAAALEKSLTILLERLAAYCSLEGHSDRFSVYYFHEDEFFMIARNAKNPTLAKRGRGRYPVAQGALAKAWSAEHGQALVSMATSKAAWSTAAKKQGFTEADISVMRMRSATIAALRIEGANRSVGVLAMETTLPKRITQAHLDLATEAHLVAAIGELVAATALLMPEGEALHVEVQPAPATKWLSTKPREAVEAGAA